MSGQMGWGSAKPRPKRRDLLAANQLAMTRWNGATVEAHKLK